MDVLCEEMGYVCETDTRCGDNTRCPNNTHDIVTSVEELCRVFGDRCVLLGDKEHLMNTFGHPYSYQGKDLPDEFLHLEVAENRKFRNLGSQLTYTDHHLQVFYQGAKTAENMFLVCGTYHYKDDSGATLGRFARLPKVCLIMDSTGASEVYHKGDGVVNPKYLHYKDPALDLGRQIWRYPYMLIIGGEDVDMGDAVRFACSLVLSFGSTCNVCQRDLTNKHSSGQYIDIWSAALETKRSQHYGYGGSSSK